MESAVVGLVLDSSVIIAAERKHQNIEEVERLNRVRRLKRPELETFSFARTTLDAILVKHRKGKRRKRRFHPARRRWKSLAHVKGFKNLRKLS